MNILLYLFNHVTTFIIEKQKKLLILTPFILGILFSLLYIWHIHKYYFVFPKSTLLYVLSSLSFLTSIVIVLKHAHDIKILQKIIQGILLICLLLSIGYLLSELKILEYKVLRFRLIKIVTLILFIVNTILMLCENQILPKSYRYTLNNKLEIFIYCICLIPFIIYVSCIYPGSADPWDTVIEYLQSFGVNHPIANWHSSFITFMMRLSLALHLPALSFLYIINICGIVYSAITLSRIPKKQIFRYLLLMITYIFPLTMNHFFLMPKDGTTTFFIMFAISMLLYSIFCKMDYHFYLGIAFLIIASLMRHNQITQTIILIIPFGLLYTHNKQIPVISSVKIIILFLIILLSIQKGIFDNKRIIQDKHPMSWVITEDIRYIMLDQKKSCEEYKSVFTTSTCQDYSKLLKKFNEIQTTPPQAYWAPITHFIYMGPFIHHNKKLWAKYILNNPGSWLTFRYTGSLYNFLKGYNYQNFINYKETFNRSPYLADQMKGKQKYGYSIGQTKLNKNGRINHLITKFSTHIRFKHKLTVMILIVIMTFIINKFKFLPTSMDSDCKYTCISYYLSLSCITLFIPLVLLVPTGWEGRYLGGVDCPLLVSIIMLLIYLYKKYTCINLQIGQK